MSTNIQLDAQAVAALYDTDLYAWANTNAELLRQGKYQQVDIAHLIEEIEDMGKSEQRGMSSHFKNLLMHMLKWQYQPVLRNNSWLLTINNSRDQLSELIQENPRLSDLPESTIDTIYIKARRDAALETSLPLSIFPATCPYTFAQALTEDWLPSLIDSKI